MLHYDDKLLCRLFYTPCKWGIILYKRSPTFCPPLYPKSYKSKHISLHPTALCDFLITQKHLEAPYFIGVRGVSHSIFLYQFGYEVAHLLNKFDTNTLFPFETPKGVQKSVFVCEYREALLRLSSEPFAVSSEQYPRAYLIWLPPLRTHILIILP